MASTFSDLKFELIGTGDQSGTWGITTNDNIGVAIEDAITGSADVTFASADVTVTLTDTVAAQTARNLRLNLTGTTGGARNLILGSGCQIEKLYLINNGTADTITVKNTTGTGIAVPAGKSMFVYNDATNVVDATTHLSSLTLGTALPITSGGTGSTSTTFVNLASNVTGTLPIANGGTGSTSTTFVDLASNVTGQLPLSNGGTGANLTDPNADRILFWDDSATSVAFLEAGSGLSISGTTLTATASFATPLTVVGNATAGAEIRLPEDTDNGSNYVAIKAPDNIASNATLTAPAVTDTLATIGTAQTFTAAQTFQAANAIRSEAASTQDAVVIAGRAGGTSSYAVTLTPATLASNTTLTLPNLTDTVAVLGAAQTFTALQTFSGSTSVAATKLANAKEVATISATEATGTINYDITTQSVLYYTSNASANWTVNFRGSSGTSLDTLMSTGESMTVAFLVTQGSTAYYNSAVQVDGSSVTPKYQGGTAWSAGNASSIDAYVYTIVKTGSAAFTVFASQTRFA